MSTEMKTGLVLSGGGAVGAYQAGVVKALAECGTQISMVSGASIGAFNGAIIAASPDLSEAAVRLEALWDHLGNNQVLSVNRLVYFSLLKKLFQAMNLCQIPGRAGALLTTLLRHISTINGFDNLMAQPLLSDEPLTALMDHYLDTDALADGLPLYVSLYPTEGGMQDIIDCIRAELGVGTTKNAVFQHIQSLPRGQQKEALLASAALPLLFRPREVQGTMFGDGGMGGCPVLSRQEKMSLPCAICSFCTRTGESHSTGFISPDASLNTAGVFIYKQKGKPIIMEWTPRP